MPRTTYETIRSAVLKTSNFVAVHKQAGSVWFQPSPLPALSAPAAALVVPPAIRGNSCRGRRERRAGSEEGVPCDGRERGWGMVVVEDGHAAQFCKTAPSEHTLSEMSANCWTSSPFSRTIVNTDVSRDRYTLYSYTAVTGVRSAQGGERFSRNGASNKQITRSIPRVATLV
jgi:hypothetical protein